MNASSPSVEMWSPASAGELKAALLLRLRSQGIRAIGVLRAMENVPRDSFVPRRYLDWAARDIALPIGCGQTTAEPSFVARAIDALACTTQSRVLEIGSGSGYVTALLGHIAAAVVGVERYRSLAEAAQARLALLGQGNVSITWGDGLAPLPGGPFDRIIVHAALDSLPGALLDGLAPDGILVYPLRSGLKRRQDLMKVARTGGGPVSQSRVCSARLQAALPGRALVL